MSSLTPEFWQDLQALRECSRMVLIALEEDDLDEVGRLSRESDRRLAAVKPFIEARLASVTRTEEDLALREILASLERTNHRILAEIETRKERTRADLGVIRQNRAGLLRYRSDLGAEPAFLDRSS